MLLFEDLAKTLGGRVRTLGSRTWLDTWLGGLRAVVIRRVTAEHTVAFELAVFMKRSRARDPFFEPQQRGEEWMLEGKRDVPALKHGFVFSGCHLGVLFARSTSEPSLDATVATLWELVALARHNWLRILYFQTSPTWRERWRARVRYIWEQRDRVLVVLVAMLAWLLFR